MSQADLWHQCWVGVQINLNSWSATENWLSSHQILSVTFSHPHSLNKAVDPAGTNHLTFPCFLTIVSTVCLSKWSLWSWLMMTASSLGMSSILQAAFLYLLCRNIFNSQASGPQYSPSTGSVSIEMPSNWTYTVAWPIQVTCILFSGGLANCSGLTCRTGRVLSSSWN